MRETLKWLDEVTSSYPDTVTLQGADETYERWSDVERFAVPRTLFSENDGADDFEAELDASTDEPPTEGMSSLALDDNPPRTPASSAASVATGLLTPDSMLSQHSLNSAGSPPTSPVKPVLASPKPDSGSASGSSSSFVPRGLQPLFNYILWRIHQEIDPVAALESFIFLCNDATKVNYAKGFEIKTKRLEQLREAISREDRDDKNRVMLLNRENQSVNLTNSPSSQPRIDQETDTIENKSPPKAPAAMSPVIHQKRLSATQTVAPVMDPNAFDRNAVPTGPSSSAAQAPAMPQSPRLQKAAPIHSSRGGFPARGNGRGNVRGGNRGRGNGAARGGGGGGAPSSPSTNKNKRKDSRANPDAAATAGPTEQIDPDSFSRPRGDSLGGRGGRKLWVPK